jgi:tRNA threonylcarbamoyladenosine biosynthesis protein TsaE
MTEWRLHLPDAEAQRRFGAVLGGVLSRALNESAVGAGQALLVTLQGDLGTGKTTLVRGLLRGRGYQGPVRSPTFTLVEPYDVVDGRVYHLDLYRLGDGEELEYLGLRDMLAEPALLLIEWPERGAGWLPVPAVRIELFHTGVGANESGNSGRDLCLRVEPDLVPAIAPLIQAFDTEAELKK